MALTTCPDCKSEVSTEAAACPKCGRPTVQAQKTAQGQQRAGLVLLLVVVGVGFWSFRSMYRAMTGADVVGTTCFAQFGDRDAPGTQIPLSKTSDAAARAYGAGLAGRVTGSDLDDATWIPSGATATIQEKNGQTYRVTTASGSGWIAIGLCKR